MRVSGIDGLRGFAALTVFLHHAWLFQYADKFPSDKGLEAAVFRELRLGLVCFFVLTGYLLYRGFVKSVLLQKPLRISRYAWHRAGRILPAYYVSLIGAWLVLRNLSERPGIATPVLDHWWMHLVMLQNYDPNSLLHLNTVTWTLGVETAFYALLPLLALLIYKTKSVILMPLVLICVGLWFNVYLGASEASDVMRNLLPTFFPIFAIGMLLAVFEQKAAIINQEWVASKALTLSLIVIGTGLVVANGTWEHLTHFNQNSRAWFVWDNWIRDNLSGLGFGLIVFAVVFGKGFSIKWAGNKWLSHLGEVSYSFYLWHLIVINFLREHGVEGFLLMLPLSLIISYAIALASYHFVEKPGIKWAKNRTN